MAANSGGFHIGIQPWATVATRCRVSFALPPIQIGSGSWTGVGCAELPRTEK